MGGGPPLVESGETGAPPQAAPTARPAAGQKSPAATAAPGAEAKAAAQERFLLVAATYANQKQAQDLLKRLKARNYRAKIVQSPTGGKTLYQVQVGPVTGAKAAEDLAQAIKTQEKITPKVMKLANAKTPIKTSGKTAAQAAKKTAPKTGAAGSRGAAR